MAFVFAKRSVISLTELLAEKSRISRMLLLLLLCIVALSLNLRPRLCSYSSSGWSSNGQLDLHVSLNGCSFRCLLLEYFEVL